MQAIAEISLEEITAFVKKKLVMSWVELLSSAVATQTHTYGKEADTAKFTAIRNLRPSRFNANAIGAIATICQSAIKERYEEQS